MRKRNVEKKEKDWRRSNYEDVVAATYIPEDRISLGRGVLAIKKGIRFRLFSASDYPTSGKTFLALVAERSNGCHVLEASFQESVDLASLRGNRRTIGWQTLLSCHNENNINALLCATVAETAYLRFFRSVWHSNEPDLLHAVMSMNKEGIPTDESPLCLRRKKGEIVATEPVDNAKKVFCFERSPK